MPKTSYRPLKAKSSANRLVLLSVLFMLILGVSAFADEGGNDILKGTKFEVVGYLDYSNGRSPLPNDEYTEYNEFGLKRAYFTFKKTFPAWIGMRVTMDAHQDDTGDYKIREKYFYAELRGNGAGPFTDLKSEIGLGHIPWLDFEEHINPYRCQGTMAIERAGIFNSADLGVSLRGNFGGKLDEAKAKTGNSHYDGKYGSWHIGVYNGGGYHADENNENKTLQGRVTFRPVPEYIPGLQLSYFTIYGKGNVETEPDYNVNLGMISYESPMLAVTAQYYITDGNAKGNWLDGTDNSLKTAGYSLFGRVAPFNHIDLAFFGRYDYFDSDKDAVISDKGNYSMIVAGFAYNLYKGNMVIFDIETTSYDDDCGGKGKTPVVGNMLGDDLKVQLVYQVKY